MQGGARPVVFQYRKLDYTIRIQKHNRSLICHFSNSNMIRSLYVLFEIFSVSRNSRGDATFLSEVYHRQLRTYIQF